MKKRILIVTLILMVCLSVIGCSTNDEANATDINQNEINAVVTTNEAEVVEETEVEVVTEEQLVEYGDYKGFLWEVKNEEATVYLFGSIHMASDKLYPMHEVVEKAFESSDVLAVEADVSDMKAVQSIAHLMMYDTNENVYDHLSEEGTLKFESITEELGFSPKLLERFRVWVVGSNLMALQLAQSEYSGTDGVDMYFLNQAKKTEKVIEELEGLEFQINMMNNFSDEEQETLFVTGLGTTEETVADFKELYDYYLSEDLDTMTSYMFSDESELTSNDALEDKMLKDRNIGMTEKIDAYLQTDKTYFVVVGLAHYLGEDSVLKYLEEKGYSVERK